MNRERFSTRILFAADIQCVKSICAIGAMFEEVFQTNFLYDRIIEFYRAANASEMGFLTGD